MATINSDGLKIKPQNLADSLPTVEDHFRLFSHDGTGTITATNGTSVNNAGFYLWDNNESAWRPLKNTVTDTEWFAGNGPSHYLLDVEEDDTLLAADVTAIDFTGHLNVIDDADGTVTIDPSHSHSLGDLSNVSATGEGSGGGFDADTVDGFHAEDLGVNIEEDGTLSVSSSTGINFTGHLNVIDDGDGTITVDPTHDHDSSYLNVSGDSMAGTLDMAGNDFLDGTTTVWDSTNQYVPQTSLQNDSLTITAGSGLTGGGSVSLGGSVTVNHDGTADTVDGYHIQKNGTDGTGIINFKT